MMKTYRKLTQELSKITTKLKVESINIKKMNNTPNLSKNNNMEVPKVKNLTMKNCQITKLIPPMFIIINHIGML